MTVDTSKQTILKALSIIGALSVLPFAIKRFSDGDWLLGFVDLLISIGMLAIYVFVYRTKRTEVPSTILALINSIGVLASIYIKGLDQIYWIFPAMIAAYYLISSTKAVFLNLFLLVTLTPLINAEQNHTSMFSILITIIITNLFAYVFSLNVEKQRIQLVNLATKDVLTGAGNRRALNTKLAELIAGNQRAPQCMSLLLFDLDHFKRVNDEFGHIIGDDILQQVAKIVQHRIRETDSLYRFGGEEFIIVPVLDSLESATYFAEQLRILIEQHEFQHHIKVTSSFGVAKYIEGESPEQWINRADSALYQAKQNGRNCVCEALQNGVSLPEIASN